MNKVCHVLASVCLLLSCFMVSFAQAEGIKTVNLNELESILEKHQGKVVVVNFFATWCPPCREEIPGLVEIVEERGKDVVILGLSVDESAAPLPSFIKSFDINYEVVRAHTDIQQLFEVTSIPHNVVFNKKGEIVANESGFVTKNQLNAFIDTLQGEK